MAIRLVEVRRTSEGPLGVGTTHTFVRNFIGRKMEATNEYVAYEPDERITFKTTSGPMRLEASYLFESAAGGTKLTSRIEMEAAGLLGLVEPLVAAGLRPEMKAALPALKTCSKTAWWRSRPDTPEDETNLPANDNALGVDEVGVLALRFAEVAIGWR